MRSQFLKDNAMGDKDDKNDKKFNKIQKNQDNQLKLISKGFQTMNSALEALLKDKKVKPQDQVEKNDQSEDIRKLVVAISKQQQKMEEMDSEINQLKIELKN